MEMFAFEMKMDEQRFEDARPKQATAFRERGAFESFDFSPLIRIKLFFY